MTKAWTLTDKHGLIPVVFIVLFVLNPLLAPRWAPWLTSESRSKMYKLCLAVVLWALIDNDGLYRDKCSDSFKFYLKNEKNASISLSTLGKIVLRMKRLKKFLKVKLINESKIKHVKETLKTESSWGTMKINNNYIRLSFCCPEQVVVNRSVMS